LTANNTCLLNITGSSVLNDSLNDITVEIAADFLAKPDCGTAIAIILHYPEIPVVKALERYQRAVQSSRGRPEDVCLH
jgi:hypothetical protein